MTYVKTDDGLAIEYPYTKKELKRDNPNTLFSVINDEVMARYNAFPVREVTPVLTDAQKLERSNMPVYQDGEWLLVHAAVDKTQEEINAELSKIRGSKRETLKAEREAIEAEPINNFQVYRVDDQQKIEKAIKYFEQYQDVNGQRLWVMADNSVKLVTKAELEVLEELQVDKVDKAYTAYMHAVNAIQNSTDPDFIQAVTIGDYYNA